MTLTPCARRPCTTWISRSVSVSVSDDVGSSMIRICAFRERDLAISTICCWASERWVQRRVGGDAQAEAVQERLGLVAHAAPVHQAQRAARERLAPQEDVAGHVQVVQHVEFLVDEADARALGVGDAPDDDGPAADADLAGVGLVDAAEDLHQGALAGPVLADQGDDLAARHLQADVLEGLDAGEALGNARHRQHRRRHRVGPHLPRRPLPLPRRPLPLPRRPLPLPRRPLPLPRRPLPLPLPRRLPRRLRHQPPASFLL